MSHIETIVAEVYDPASNKLVDKCFSWETGQNYAKGNYKVVAIADDRYMTVDKAQELYDYERRLAQDCWDLDETDTMNEW